ncbi:MAG: peptidylprolyl isomerase [Verrucomicrobia bacterium]|nr:MAG: peptidylprolyl isomerase [Verrucomicrobiota bacterium]
MKIFGSLLCAFLGFSSLLWAQSQDGSGELVDGIAAIVNSDVVTISDVREVVGGRERALREAFHGEELQKKLEELKKSAVKDLIDRQLILQEFRAKKFTIPSYIVDEQVQKIIREEFGGNRMAFVQTIQAQGYTLTRFKRMEMDKIIVMAMRQENVKDNFIISPNKIQEYYNGNIRAYTTPEQVKLRMIIVREGNANSDIASTGDKKAMAEEIRANLAKGANFDRMARMYSEDSSSQDSGGDWGWVERGTLNPTLSDVAFSMKPGEVSPVVAIGNTYYILTVEARKNAAVKKISEVRNEIERNLIQQERLKGQDQWLETLRRKAYIKIFS